MRKIICSMFFLMLVGCNVSDKIDDDYNYKFSKTVSIKPFDVCRSTIVLENDGRHRNVAIDKVYSNYTCNNTNDIFSNKEGAFSHPYFNRVNLPYGFEFKVFYDFETELMTFATNSDDILLFGNSAEDIRKETLKMSQELLTDARSDILNRIEEDKENEIKKKELKELN